MRDFTSWTMANELESEQASPDLEIPTLAAALNPVRLRKNLRFLSLPPWQWGELNDARIQVLRCHKGRCTLEIGLSTTTGPHTLIGKVYALDEPEIFVAMQRISQAGFGPEVTKIPAPLLISTRVAWPPRSAALATFCSAATSPA